MSNATMQLRGTGTTVRVNDSGARIVAASSSIGPFGCEPTHECLKLSVVVGDGKTLVIEILAKTNSAAPEPEIAPAVASAVTPAVKVDRRRTQTPKPKAAKPAVKPAVKPFPAPKAAAKPFPAPKAAAAKPAMSTKPARPSPLVPQGLRKRPADAMDGAAASAPKRVETAKGTGVSAEAQMQAAQMQADIDAAAATVSQALAKAPDEPPHKSIPQRRPAMASAVPAQRPAWNQANFDEEFKLADEKTRVKMLEYAVKNADAQRMREKARTVLMQYRHRQVVKQRREKEKALRAKADKEKAELERLRDNAQQVLAAAQRKRAENDAKAKVEKERRLALFNQIMKAKHEADAKKAAAASAASAASAAAAKPRRDELLSRVAETAARHNETTKRNQLRKVEADQRKAFADFQKRLSERQAKSSEVSDDEDDEDDEDDAPGMTPVAVDAEDGGLWSPSVEAIVIESRVSKVTRRSTRGGSKEMQDVRCGNCGQKGHRLTQCPQPDKDAVQVPVCSAEVCVYMGVPVRKEDAVERSSGPRDSFVVTGKDDDGDNVYMHACCMDDAPILGRTRRRTSRASARP